MTERMVDEITSIMVKYGYRCLGYQQTLGSDCDLLRFVKGKTRIDIIEDEMDDETYVTVMDGVDEL